MFIANNQSQGNMQYFWFFAGLMTGLAAAFVVLRLLPVAAPATDVDEGAKQRSRWLLPVVVAVIAAVSIGLYLKLGRPGVASTAQDAQPSSVNGAHPQVSNSAGGTGSMAEVVAKLETKLAAGAGSDADWQLLQQSYEFMGDAERAQLAQQHQLGQSGQATATVAGTDDSSTLVMYQQLTRANPKDASAWRATAQLQRKQRAFAEAVSAYERLSELKAMTADDWADYADAAAAMADTLSTAKTRTALDAALKMQPTHAKALWLKASLAVEEKRYANAVTLWQQLRAVTPDTSSDVKIIEANLAESRSLIGSSASVASTATTVRAARIEGAVNIDKAVAAKVGAGMTLFIYAKAADSAAPVAAFRTTVKNWPASYVLDDSLAMMPTRVLSQFDQVVVQARLSRSGQAMAQAGDLQSAAVTVDPRAGKPVLLAINSVVP